MKKSFAASTLKRKYRQTGLSEETIKLVQTCLLACANLYYILDIEEVWQVIGPYCGIDRESFDQLVAIIARDGDMKFLILEESDLFDDGEDILLLISLLCVVAVKPGITDADVEKALEMEEAGMEYDGSALAAADWDRFYDMYEKQIDKELYIPRDILPYADMEYFEDTPAVRAMLKFLQGKCADPRDMVLNMVLEIKSERRRAAKRIQSVIDDLGSALRSQRDLETLIALYQDLHNNTRMPANKGHTPNEMFKPGLPSRMSFSSGIQNALRTGELDGKDMKRQIELGKMPRGIKDVFADAVDQTFAPSEEKWFGGTLIKGPKIGPNDPCPCGSGKKYKKCTCTQYHGKKGAIS